MEIQFQFRCQGLPTVEAVEQDYKMRLFLSTEQLRTNCGFDVHQLTEVNAASWIKITLRESDTAEYGTATPNTVFDELQWQWRTSGVTYNFALNDLDSRPTVHSIVIWWRDWISQTVNITT